MKTCKWNYNNAFDGFNTECKRTPSIHLDRDGFRYCPFCSGKLTIHKLTKEEKKKQKSISTCKSLSWDGGYG